MTHSKIELKSITRKISSVLMILLLIAVGLYINSLKETKTIEYSADEMAKKTSEKLPYGFSIKTASSDSYVTVNHLNFSLKPGCINGEVNGTIKMQSLFLLNERNAKVHANFTATPTIKTLEDSGIIELYLTPSKVSFDDINFSLVNNEGKTVESVKVNSKVNNNKDKYVQAIITKFNTEPILLIPVSNKLDDGQKKMMYGSKVYVENNKIVIKQQLLSYYIDKIIPFGIALGLAIAFLIVLFYAPELLLFWMVFN